MNTHYLARTFGVGLLASVILALGCENRSIPTQPDLSGHLGTALTITRFTPASGWASRETVITITGQGFKAGATVAFGGVPALVTALSPTSIETTTQPHDPGVVDVVVTNPDGQAVTAAARFTFTPAPSISSVTPDTGSTGGRASVTVIGSGFLNGATVTIDGVLLTTYSDKTGTELYVTTSVHAPGAVDVVVRNLDGQSATLPGAFTFAPPETFDFNGNWYAYLGDGNDYPFTFKVENNALVSLTCYEGTPVTLASPVPVSHGEMSTSLNGSVIFSARIVGPDQAVGTIDAGLCHSQDWGGWRDRQGMARLSAAGLGPARRRK